MRGAPAAPSKLIAAAVSTTQINLTWTSNSNNATGFRIERALSATGPWTQVGTASAIAISWANSGLSDHTAYYYRVIAYNSGGNSAYSNVAAATTLSMLPAGAPSNLVAMTGGSTRINLSWTNNANDATGFKIERCQGNACSSFTNIATTATNDTSYQNTRLSPSTSYSYRVRAFNSTEESGYSNTVTATTPLDTIPPTIPAELTATAVSSTKINLRWNPPAGSGGSGVAGYNVYQAGARIGSTLGTTYSVTGLAANIQYCYTVAAYDKGGNSSDQSGPACATTKPAPPSADPPSNDK
jgi:chitodextrinase